MLQSVVQQANVLQSRPDPLTCWTYSLSGQAKASMEIAPSPRKPLTCWIYSLSGRSLVGLPTVFDLTCPCYLTTFCGEMCLSGKVICAFFCPAYRSSPVYIYIYIDIIPAGKAVWDVHRHRVAPEIHEALTTYFMEGSARVQSAHLVGLRTAAGISPRFQFKKSKKNSPTF
jgi:hypothetical protein